MKAGGFVVLDAHASSRSPHHGRPTCFLNECFVLVASPCVWVCLCVSLSPSLRISLCGSWRRLSSRLANAVPSLAASLSARAFVCVCVLHSCRVSSVVAVLFLPRVLPSLRACVACSDLDPPPPALAFCPVPGHRTPCLATPLSPCHRPPLYRRWCPHFTA